MYVILNGKGSSSWLRSTQACLVCSLSRVLFLNSLFCCSCYSGVVDYTKSEYRLHYTYQHMPYRVAIVHSHVGSATTSFKYLATVAEENSTMQSPDVSIEGQLQPPSDLVTVSQ